MWIMVSHIRLWDGSGLVVVCVCVHGMVVGG